MSQMQEKAREIDNETQEIEQKITQQRALSTSRLSSCNKALATLLVSIPCLLI